jgi:small subunit ribosomal protein S16
MPVKIRLARHGRKSQPFYYIVAADSRAPRDGRYIERIGSYNPNTDPATIDLDFEKALSWLQKGAQPTDTCKAVLSYKGVIYKNHLQKGIAKGALTVEQAEEKFQSWLKQKEAQIQAKKERISTKAKTDINKRVEAEKLVNQSRQEAISKKLAKASEKPEEVVEPLEEETNQ